MWCWHRIRESESGLCPACRTPYGDDPHEFSAVDVAEVLKENKEREAAAKRERDRQRQQQNDGNLSDGEGVNPIINGNAKGQMEVPKDRSQLANMRVIRRNLVYAVGLPPTIASEDTLRKADYFGQYGKISKIVLNRNQTTGGDLRRASASAYVTFLHKVRVSLSFHHSIGRKHDLIIAVVCRRILWSASWLLMVSTWKVETPVHRTVPRSTVLPS
jgi:CCR4-NOT transcription complex subunit 4